MKKLLSLLLCIMCFLFFEPTDAFAASDTDQISEELGVSELTEGLNQEQIQITGRTPATAGYDAEGALKRLWEAGKQRLADEFHRQLSFAVYLSSIALLCALADAVTDNKAAREGISIAACCAAASVIAGDWESGIHQALSLLEQLSDYSRASLPVIYTAAAAAGAASSAPIKYAASCFVIEVMLTLSQRLLLPLICAYLALALSACLCQNSIVSALQRLLRFAAVNAMGLLTAGFCSYVSLTGLVSGSADAAAVKAARTVISSVLPVVGGILSDSAAAILSAASVVRNTAGVFAIIAVCSLSMGPFVFLLLKMLLLRAAATLAEILPDGRLARLLEQLSSVFGMLLGLVGCDMVMLLFSLAAGMRAVTG